jgi:RimJ/RimL family protein N-acetyltransferase
MEQFDLQPVLTGKLVTLRPLQQEDWQGLFAVASDPLIWEQHPASDRYQEPVFRAFFREALECGGAFVVLDAADGRVIGSSRFNRYDQEQSEIEIGWTFLARSHWGGACNAEMKTLMLNHAFNFVTTVVFYVGQTNVRSQKALEKIGAIRVGFRIDSTGGESAVYEIKKPSA